MEVTGGLVLEKKKFLGTKDVKVTTQGEIGKPAIYTDEYVSTPAFHDPLFPEGSPKIQDIKQETVGNCFMLAALLAMLQTEAGRVFMHGVMKDVGPDDDTKQPSASNPSWVVVRVYEHILDGGGPKYIKVKKVIQVDMLGNQVFHTGALWVHMLIAAFAHFDRFGSYKQDSSFAHVEGGNANVVFKMLTGAKGPFHEIMDFATVEGRTSIAHTSEGKYGKNFATFLQLKDATSAGNAEILKKVFGGNAINQKTYTDWLNRPKTKFGAKPGPPHREFLEELITRQQKTLRREHVERLFRDNGPNAGTTAVMNWIDANNILPGKRGSHSYTPYDLSVFRFIHQNFHLGRAVCLATRQVFPGASKGTDGQGGAGEIKVKGLVSGHAYAVCDVEKDQENEYWITVRNPWGSYGRSYTSDRQAVSNPEDNAVSRLTLGDVMKNFKNVEVGVYKLQG